MKDGTYITIQSWMRTELNLKGNDLLVYAIIFGFSQAEDIAFTGSLQYLADWCGATKQGILKNLKNLLDAGLIKKIENGVNSVSYYATEFNIPCSTQFNGVLNSVEQGVKLSLTNNIDNTKIDKIDKLVSKDTNTNFQFGSKQKPKKESLYTKCASLIYAKTDDSEVQKLLFSWLNMLLEKYKDRGKALYVNVFKGKLNMLDKYDEKDWADIIRYNIQRGYEGFYPISISCYSDIKEKPWEKNVKSEGYTEEEKRQIELEREEMLARGEQVWY